MRYELIRIDGKIKIFLRIYTGCSPAVAVRVDDEGGIHNNYQREGISMISFIILRIGNRNINAVLSLCTLTEHGGYHSLSGAHHYDSPNHCPSSQQLFV